VQWLDDDVTNLDEALAVTDLVVCGKTGFADDALISGITPILVDLDGLSGPMTVGLGADGPQAGTSEELAAIIRRWQDDPHWREALRERSQARGRSLCSWSGAEAARRTAEAIRAIATPRPGQRPSPSRS